MRAFETGCWCWCCELARVETGCWCWVLGAGAGAVGWLCTWWRQVAGAGAGSGCVVPVLELAVHVVETGCWCWCCELAVPGGGAGAARGGGWCWCRVPVLGAAVEVP